MKHSLPPQWRDSLLIPDWPAPKEVMALQSTRLSPTDSPLAFDDFNLRTPDARNTLAEVLPTAPHWLQQKHTTDVLPASNTPSPSAAPLPIADASCTEKNNVVCAVMTADCLPVLLCSDQGDWVSACHAGWRGLCHGVLENALQRYSGSGNILAWLGPCIQQAAFEVGEEVREAFIEADPLSASAFAPGKQTGKWQCSLAEIAVQRLQQQGVSNITNSGECTFSRKERFFSWRRDASDSRMATFIWLQAKQG